MQTAACAVNELCSLISPLTLISHYYLRPFLISQARLPTSQRARLSAQRSWLRRGPCSKEVSGLSLPGGDCAVAFLLLWIGPPLTSLLLALAFMFVAQPEPLRHPQPTRRQKSRAAHAEATATEVCLQFPRSSSPSDRLRSRPRFQQWSLTVKDSTSAKNAAARQPTL